MRNLSCNLNGSSRDIFAVRNFLKKILFRNTNSKHLLQLLFSKPNYRMISSCTLMLKVLFGRIMLLITTTSSSTATASPEN